MHEQIPPKLTSFRYKFKLVALTAPCLLYLLCGQKEWIY